MKICGLTDRKQAEEIAYLGATHIGMIYFEKSPRHIDLEKIKEISTGIKGRAKSVAVVVNPAEKTVWKLLEIVDIIQFHGEESMQFVSSFPKEKVIKAFRIKDETDIEKIKPFVEENYTILIDAYSEKAYGGTGKQINPELAKKVVQMHRRTVLSGGLSPENVEKLLRQIKPYGVDASSKLEIKPGVKDLKKVKEFIERVKRFYESDS
nr:phosphoribosylanthranilate isomerase [Persephonella atlantica]